MFFLWSQKNGEIRPLTLKSKVLSFLVENYLNVGGLVGQSFGFLMEWGTSPRANILHQSNFWSSENTKACPYPWTVPGAIGYFCFSSTGSIKNSMATFSIFFSKSRSIPWFITCMQRNNQYMLFEIQLLYSACKSYNTIVHLQDANMLFESFTFR